MLKRRNMRYPEGTIINSHDRKYIVDQYGCWRVYEYKETHWSKKEKK